MKALSRQPLMKRTSGVGLNMIRLSTGSDSTLGEYLKLSTLFFGAESKATQFIKEKIEQSFNGVNEEVIASESQMIHFLATISD